MNGSRGKHWPADAVANLKKMWDAGDSSSVIAAHFNTTRNAVIGIIHRHKWQRYTTPAGKAALVTRQHKRASREKFEQGKKAEKPNFSIKKEARPVPPTPIIEPPPPPVSPLGIRLLDLDPKKAMCRWPLGDPREPGFHFCGHKQKPGRVYCPYHCTIAYQPVEKRHARDDERLATRAG